ncbi:biotin-dependent carboxyltransferase family protein [Staphylococcus succinus]|uniref:5-oxoprolinase subunit C family protein n=1 Tax=Staphylococcus succinus TaxID=61015 RepID=UPI002DB9F4A7|nr:biotin-dependent carboxyltransferase family protein [Staphylococcus succinus]MEB7461318.1 biotin-dependent carboxyltransferase family protein [Staphylococcus succinus]
MSIKIIKPGLFSTVQDKGRIGYQDQGFSTAGALDLYAFMLGQTLIGNKGPAIECTVIGPVIEFLEENTFVITGADFDSQLNDCNIPSHTVIKARKGDVLTLGAAIEGARGYILFGNPIDIPKVANSYATHVRSKIGGFQGRSLKQNDIIHCLCNENYAVHLGYSAQRDTDIFKQQTIHIIEGPQINAFTQDKIATLTSTKYKISEKSDRMGFRLHGKTIPPQNGADIISEPVALGSIQVPNDGNPIILLNDKQTVGGYTKIATVSAIDLPILAQKKPGDTIYFEWVSVEAATQKLKQKEVDFKTQLERIETMPIYDMSQLRSTSIRIKKLLKGESQ